MLSFSNTIFYILIFLTVYAQVFFLVTFLENRKKIVIRKGATLLSHYPPVTIAVPSWNEKRTVEGTIRSLLALNYPKDKLKIFLIDDGSTDGTLEVLRSFENYPNIKVFRKVNGGKHTALNLALKNIETEFFGCLDADSYADPDSLARIMSYFEKDTSTMAVTPSVVVNRPQNIVQGAQRAEYNMGIYLKKMLGFLGAINVTPGPLTIFKKKVFDDLGPYRHGHSTEDMEIAFRMQKNHYKIEHCNDAFVYTSTPRSIMKLHKQRVRWIYGFINNTLDYKSVIFRKKYGNFGTFTLPLGVISLVAVSYVFGRIIYNIGTFVYEKVLEFQTVGLNLRPSKFIFDPFFINTQSIIFLVIAIYLLVIFSVVVGRRMVDGKWGITLNMFYYFVIFSIAAPFWFLKALLNTLVRRAPSWR